MRTDQWLAVAAALVIALGWVCVAYADKILGVGDEVGARLDAMAVAEVGTVPAADRYARFERRDYDHERGPAPVAKPRYPTLYDELCARLGNPLGNAR